jgi:hypothetical protein
MSLSTIDKRVALKYNLSGINGSDGQRAVLHAQNN